MGILIFFIGFLAGVVVGVFLLALCSAGRYHDDIPDDTDREECE